MTEIERQGLKKAPRANSSLNRHAERTAQTRARLLEAGEKIFARDGFEAAKLEEIATEAGYTRGAFYANFASKEDLFIALLAEEVERRMARASQLARATKPTAQILRENYIQSLKNKTWNVLFIEYKLFILRHPEFKEKVTEMQAKAFATTSIVLEEIYRGAGIKLPVSTLAAAISLAAVANTLGIDLMIGKAITEKEVDTILGLFFDALAFQHS
ncbi:MAG TPA: TetR/AcrR family transcriptional regulator [Pseudacidobacterium sp.]|nr:TetR/AcrR family transcriptional regulator [Pseudacidobacterium sp.]